MVGLRDGVTLTLLDTRFVTAINSSTHARGVGMDLYTTVPLCLPTHIAQAPTRTLTGMHTRQRQTLLYTRVTAQKKHRQVPHRIRQVSTRLGCASARIANKRRHTRSRVRVVRASRVNTFTCRRALIARHVLCFGVFRVGGWWGGGSVGVEIRCVIGRNTHSNAYAPMANAWQTILFINSAFIIHPQRISGFIVLDGWKRGLFLLCMGYGWLLGGELS